MHRAQEKPMPCPRLEDPNPAALGNQPRSFSSLRLYVTHASRTVTRSVRHSSPSSLNGSSSSYLFPVPLPERLESSNASLRRQGARNTLGVFVGVLREPFRTT